MSKRFGDFDELVLTRCLLPGIQVLLGRIRAFDDAVIHNFAGRVVESVHTADAVTNGYEDRTGWQFHLRHWRNDWWRICGR